MKFRRLLFIFLFLLSLAVLYYFIRENEPDSNKKLKENLTGVFESKNLDGSIEDVHYTFELKSNGRFFFDKAVSNLLSQSGKWRLTGHVPNRSLNLYFDNGKTAQINPCREVDCIFYFRLPNGSDYVPFVKISNNN